MRGQGLSESDRDRPQSHGDDATRDARGAGAELFAERHGFVRAELLHRSGGDLARAHARAPTGSNLYADSYQMYMAVVHDWVNLLHDRILGTTNVIVRDAAGDIASTVSTSGWGFKWPGRVGDSPIIGAGNYADNRYGAAACTGRGEMAIRASTAYSIVRSMRDGLALEEALRRAMLDLRDLVDAFAERVNVMNAVAMDRDGNVGAVSTAPDTFFVFQSLETCPSPRSAGAPASHSRILPDRAPRGPRLHRHPRAVASKLFAAVR